MAHRCHLSASARGVMHVMVSAEDNQLFLPQKKKTHFSSKFGVMTELVSAVAGRRGQQESQVRPGLACDAAALDFVAASRFTMPPSLSSPQARRLVVASASLLALLACVALAVRREAATPDALTAQLAFGDAAFHGAKPAAVREGSVRGNVAPKYTPPGGLVDEYGLKAPKIALAQVPRKQVLAFGDAKVVKDADAAAREGSVRNGVKPDFQKPLGDLGEVGLARKAAAGVKPAAMKGKTQALAFGDAKVVKDADAAAREGSVRHGKKPDFQKPLGDLGETGLAGAPLRVVKKQQLAFGDASFHSSADAAAREGSVRGNVKPDFKKPLGDLGETGLAAVKAKGGKKLSAAAARSELDAFYSSQAKALKVSSPPELTSKAAKLELATYYTGIEKAAAQDHSKQLAQALSDEKSQRGSVSKYYQQLQTKDAKLHAKGGVFVGCGLGVYCRRLGAATAHRESCPGHCTSTAPGPACHVRLICTFLWAAVAKEHAQDAAVAARLAAAASKPAAAKRAPQAKAEAHPQPAAKAAAPSAKQARAQQLDSVSIESKLSPLRFGHDQGASPFRVSGTGFRRRSPGCIALFPCI